MKLNEIDNLKEIVLQLDPVSQAEHLALVNKLVDLLARDILADSRKGVNFDTAIKSAMHMLYSDIKQRLDDRITELAIGMLEK